MSRERERLAIPHAEHMGWQRWGPFVSERSWATVREDYSEDGNAWDFFPHDHARSRAYRWGEDGIAGICDRYQLLVFAPAFWNGVDPILKERLFGLTSAEGNHGEDVKEYYFHLDNTPSHSYMKYLYKYPQAPFPYAKLVEESRKRGTHDFEYELLDTGIFNEDRYFDITIEYGKVSDEDVCIRIEAINRGPDPAPIHIIPNLWFRNTWAWTGEFEAMPRISLGESGGNHYSVVTEESEVTCLTTVPVTYKLGRRRLLAETTGRVLFTNNETNHDRVGGQPHGPATPYVKDAFHRHIIQGEDCVNPEQFGTKAGYHFAFDAIPPGGSAVVRLRLTNDFVLGDDPLAEVDPIIDLRRIEADEFYETVHPPDATEDEKRIQRQALSGLLWTKQSYLFDVNQWLRGDRPDAPPPASRYGIRNHRWKHLNSLRIMSVCDKWEYPWFAAWDLAFHTVPLCLVDPEYAKKQLWLILFEQFQHPNGQIPAYEWEFSDLNPPVHAWAVWRVYNMDRIRSGVADRGWLERCFHKLLMNFAWWVNRVDSGGNNIFEGGFLGLDNITVVDRSEMSGDAVLEQSDATGWMGMFCLNLMRIALELAKTNDAYEALATKFFQHYVYVAGAMTHMGNRDYQLWDEEDGFFYDVLSYPDGRFHKFRLRSLVGLIPMFAVERLEEDWIAPFEKFTANLNWFLTHRQDLTRNVVHTIERDGKKTHVLTILNSKQLQRISERLCSSEEFLSDYGIRSLSKAHEHSPFSFNGAEVGYEPAESHVRIKGGNSNWRGPIWFPTTFLLIESLRKMAKGFGDESGARLEDGTTVPFPEMARTLADRMISIFTRNARGERPVYGGTRKFQDDEHWRDLILFYEYFHGDNGAGLGASHQTGWTALVASLIDEWR